MFFILSGMIYENTWKVLPTRKAYARLDIQSFYWASLMAQMVKNPPATWETQFWSLSWEDPLEKGMATHSSILAWRIPKTEKPGRLRAMGSQRVEHNWVNNTNTFSAYKNQKTSFLSKWWRGKSPTSYTFFLPGNSILHSPSKTF